MTENSYNAFWSSSILISVIIGGCVLLLMYIIRLFKNDNQKGKVASVKNVTRHIDKETKTKKKSTDTKWAVRAEKQHMYTHPWLLTTLKGHTGHVLDMDFNSSGKYLASCAEEPDPGGFADVDTSSSTSSSVEDTPVNASHMHSGPGPQHKHLDASTVARKPGLSRRQRKNRRREDTSATEKKKQNRRYQTNPVAMYQPLSEHVQLNMPDAELWLLLQRYKLTTTQMGYLSFPIESEYCSGRVIIVKGRSSLCSARLKPTQFFRVKRSPPRFDVNARDFVPDGARSCLYYDNSQRLMPLYFYGAAQDGFTRPVVPEESVYEVRACLDPINYSDLTSSDDDYTLSTIPSVVYTRSPNSAFETRPRFSNASNYGVPRPVNQCANVSEEERECRTPPPETANDHSDQTNASSNLVLSPRTQFKQSVWEAANDNSMPCPDSRVNNNHITDNPNNNSTSLTNAQEQLQSYAQEALQGIASKTLSNEVYVTLVTVVSDSGSTTSGSSSSSSRSESSEELSDYAESGDSLHGWEPPTFHYSPEGAMCFCINRSCTRVMVDMLTDVLPVPMLDEGHTCARCTKQFEISESGEYVEQEQCQYHWGRLQRPCGDARYLAYSCCGMGEGIPGCTKGKAHVWTGIEYGVNGPFDSFVRTPERSAASTGNSIYAVDCEMCYTVRGLELTKVTVIASDGRPVYDCFVRPDNEIIDYNTRYSGITAGDLNRKGGNIKSLREVQNDLMGFIYADTILVGHGLENDLRALKIVHGAVVDTSIVFPHVRGLPYRRSLKSLVKTQLHRDIQTSRNGHDSYEDARACMQLVLSKIVHDFGGYSNPSGQYVNG